MDSIFLLGEADRAAFLQHMMQSFGCTYICLWSYLPLPSNCLLYLDGVYKEESSSSSRQALISSCSSSSSGISVARMLFNAYCDQSVKYLISTWRRVPGFAFKNNLPYLEMNLDTLQSMASTQVQMQFYQTVVFMGCTIGELELGMSSEPQVNLEMEMKNWFPVDFSRQTAPSGTSADQTLTNQKTSSSSLRSLSLSIDSVEYSPPIFPITSSPNNFITEPPKEAAALLLQENLRSDALSQIRNVQFPTIERENDAMTKAILAVLTSPSSTSHHQTQTSAQNYLPRIPIISHLDHEPTTTAFRSYHHHMALAPRVVPKTNQNKQNNMFKRAVLFFRNLNSFRRRQELRTQENRPTVTQLHHMISERRRREKLNESFHVLRSLLPHGSKKDKASVLSITTEFISSLKSQVEELRKRNQILETRLSTNQEVGVGGGGANAISITSTEKLNVEMTRHVTPSTSEGSRFLDLRVSLRSRECSASDLVIRVLGFLKQQIRNVSLLSIQSNTSMLESLPLHGLVLRLKIEGDEFDESGFQEAVRRVVDDLPH